MYYYLFDRKGSGSFLVKYIDTHTVDIINLNTASAALKMEIYIYIYIYIYI